MCQTNTLVEPESVSWVKISVPTSFVSQLQSAPNTVWWGPGESGLVQAMYRGHQPELAIGNITDEKPAVPSARKDHFQGPETLSRGLGREAPGLLWDPERGTSPQTPAEQEAQLLKGLELDSSPILAEDPALKKRVEHLGKVSKKK